MRNTQIDLHKMLSTRELEILQHLVAGLPNKTIAKQLELGEETVKVHVKGILRKLKVNNRTQAAVLAFSCGLELAMQERASTDGGEVSPRHVHGSTSQSEKGWAQLVTADGFLNALI